ncbi:ABC transporter ATP-binding protein [Halopelagius longus]|uniref:ABC transporter ATP-binding protein n=1 Tax=Halopelagius longus TaxID=1236180 RepID=A0A1H1G202_9EURY|nr:ABC transporter ATP-binding protein [Halopelagius longus]RDI69891.1 ABC transporter ATP-binding protein [Halopelagius longus]SDR07252.1 ABC-2 type transport system ATP-binding protein [Halopelagius longus]
MTAITTNRLTKRYGGVTAVNDLDLTVEEGEVFGFLGPNGAGKSTTINVLLGFTSPTAGRATVLGRDAVTESKSVRSRIGLLPEGYHLYENLTGRHHIVSAIETKRASDDPDRILERVGLASDAAHRPVGGYSKGMAQRLTLGIALVGNPELLILDEPSSGLDPTGIKHVREIVREEADRGTTVFFSSHHLEQVEKVCDRIGIMRDGSLATVGDIDTLREKTGGNVITVTVESPPDAARVRDIAGVSDVTVTETTVRLACTPEAEQIQILNRLDRFTTVQEFETEDTSLESLFETFTSDDATVDHDTDDRSGVDAGGE